LGQEEFSTIYNIGTQWWNGWTLSIADHAAEISVCHDEAFPVSLIREIKGNKCLDQDLSIP
jgi:hypothetical protein